MVNTKIIIIIIIIIFVLIKFDKQVDTIDSFNKWVVLGLKNPDSSNKHVELGLTHIVEYSWVDTTQTRHANMNCHPYTCMLSKLQLQEKLALKVTKSLGESTILVPQISTEHNWSFKFKKWVVLVLFTYMANRTMAWHFLKWHGIF